jgi:hypothetical protein
MLDTTPCRQEGRVNQHQQLRWRLARRQLQCSATLYLPRLSLPRHWLRSALSRASRNSFSSSNGSLRFSRADSLTRSPVYVGSKMTTTSTLSTVGTAPTSSVTISKRRETKGHQPMVSTITISTLCYLISIDPIKPISTTLLLRSLRQG